ncbi:MAG: hypothetical protein Q4F54_02180 [Coriobacteriia bacterium]|nr:hypothetical protein [Coriobacteriia bacterium]
MFHRCNSLVGGVEKFVGYEYSIRAKDGVDSDTPGYFTSASILKNADVSNSRSIFQDAKTINDTSKELEPLEVMIPAIQKVVFATLYDNYDMNRPYYLLSDEGASHPVLADTNYN